MLLSACGRPGVPTPIIEPQLIEMSGQGRTDVVITRPPGAAVRITVDGQSVDVLAEVRDAQGAVLARADAPGRRVGVETLLIEPGPPSRVAVRVLGNEHSSGRGTVRIEAVALPDATHGDRLRLEATRHEAAGCAVDAAGSEGHALTAAKEFARAAQIHERLGDPRAAALATLHEAQVYYGSLWNWPAASERARRALRFARQSGDRELEADALAVLGEALTESSQQTFTASHGQTANAGFAAAIEALSEAIALYRALDLVPETALTVNYRGTARHYSGDWRGAAADYAEAGELFHQLGDEAYEGMSLDSRALVYYDRGEFPRAIELYDDALARLRGNETGAIYASALHNSALPLQALGRFDEALRRYIEAAQIAHRLGDVPSEARALHGMGTTLKAAGEIERARTLLEQALALRPAGADDRSRLANLVALGDIDLVQGSPQTAMTRHREALALAASENERAWTRVALARDYLALDRLRDARSVLDTVLALKLPETNRYRARALTELGEVRARLGDDAGSDLAFALALASQTQSGSELEQIAVRTRRATIALARERYPEVLADTDAALDALERIGIEGTHAEQRTAFIASQRSAFELRIEAVVALAERAAASGDETEAASLRRKALETSERSRGHALLEALGERRAAGVVGSTFVKKRQALYERLAGKRARLDALRERASTDASLLDELSRDLAMIRAKLDAMNAGRSTPSTVDSQESALSDRWLPLPARTVAAEFFVGERACWLFLVRGESVSVHRLPPRATLEAPARAVHAEWSTPPTPRRSVRAAFSLADTLFGPLAADMPTEDLWLVADGALHLLPLPALVELRWPTLRETNIKSVPALRVAAAGAYPRPVARRGLALIADPVYSLTDARLRRASATPSMAAIGVESAMTRSALNLAHLERLPATAIEAQSILALAGSADTTVLTGARARRDTVHALPPGEYRILHFATHAWSDAEDPELATLALSMRDASGAPLDGALRLADITMLQLNADLVVLSGCETALGREILGEAPVGLAHGFLQAGARSVLASLWQVPDAATAMLMREFYRHLLRESQPAPLALRRAQEFVRSQPRWADPYYWAGFQLITLDPTGRGRFWNDKGV